MHEQSMIRPADPIEQGVLSALIPAVNAAAMYAALWGCFCSMCGISTLGLFPLSAGLGGILLFLLLPPRKKLLWIVSAGILAAAFALTILQLPLFLEGCKRILNRLFQASAARHPYLYESFSVSGAGTEGIRNALLVSGLLTGLWLAVSVHADLRLFFLLPTMLLLSGIAWLGISPEPLWLVLLTIACVFSLKPVKIRLRWIALIPAVVLTVTGVLILLLFPGQHESLSVWQEKARDRLALHTVYYGLEEPLEESPQESEEGGHSGKKPFYQKDDAEAEEGERVDWPRVFLISGLILLILILLFGPAVWSDRLKRRRAENRRGLNDPDIRTDICASFLYGLRFLREADLISGNQPFSAYAETLMEIKRDLGESCRRVVPIWQEAAYSAHPMEETQRQAVHEFLSTAKAAAEQSMNWKQKLKARYFTAL